MREFLFSAALFILLGAGCSGSASIVPATVTPAPSSIPVTVTTQTGAPTAPAAKPIVSVSTKSTVIPAALAPVSVNITVKNFTFTPTTIEAAPGQEIDIKFVGVEGFHTFVIDSLKVEKNITEGSSVSFVAPTAPGNYPFYCNVGSHRAMGMEGTLIVK